MQKYLWKPVKKTLKWKGLCKNWWACRRCHVPTILWALRLPPQEWLCSPPLASPWSASRMLPARFSVRSEPRCARVAFCRPLHSVRHRLQNLYSPCKDMPASQEWLQLGLQQGGLLHTIWIRHISISGKDGLLFSFSLSGWENWTREWFFFSMSNPE